MIINSFFIENKFLFGNCEPKLFVVVTVFKVYYLFQINTTFIVASAYTQLNLKKLKNKLIFF